MLVLTRKKGEQIRIDDQIEIVVLEVHGDRVRLGFRAPDGIAIHREEVWRRLQENGRRPVPHRATTPASTVGLGELKSSRATTQPMALSMD